MTFGSTQASRIDPELPGLDPRNVQQVVDQRQKNLTVLANDCQGIPGSRRGLS